MSSKRSLAEFECRVPMRDLVDTYVAQSVQQSIRDDTYEIEEQYRVPVPGQNSRVQIRRLPLPAHYNGTFFLKPLRAAESDSASAQIPYYSLANEAGAAMQLRALEGKMHVPVPRVYSYGPKGVSPNTYEYIATEMLPGAVPTDEMSVWYLSQFWSKKQRRSFIRKLALFRIRMLHLQQPHIGGCIASADTGAGQPMVHERMEGPVGLGSVGHRRFLGPDSNHVVFEANEEFQLAKLYADSRARNGQQLWYDIGPYPDEANWIREWLRKDALGYQEGYLPDENLVDDPNSIHRDDRPKGFRQELTHRMFKITGENTHRFRGRDDELQQSYVLRHNDLANFRNMLVGTTEGGDAHKIHGVIDWESANFVPYWWAIYDLYAKAPWEERELATIDAGEGPFGPGRYEDLGGLPKDTLRVWMDGDGNLRPASKRRKIAIGANDDEQWVYRRLHGTITVEDYENGDAEDSDDDEPDEYCRYTDLSYMALRCDDALRTHKRGDPLPAVPIRNPYANPQDDSFDPDSWAQGPVFRLVDTYAQRHMGADPLCKWRDPFTAWALNDQGEIADVEQEENCPVPAWDCGIIPAQGEVPVWRTAAGLNMDSDDGSTIKIVGRRRSAFKTSTLIAKLPQVLKQSQSAKQP